MPLPRCNFTFYSVAHLNMHKLKIRKYSRLEVVLYNF